MTKAILLTGRRGVISSACQQILVTHGLHGNRMNAHSEHVDVSPGPYSHEEYYCGDFIYEKDYPRNQKGKIDASTWTHKLYIIEKLMGPQIKKLELWDDRLDHVPHLMKCGLDMIREYGVEVIFHRVFSNEFGATVQHIPIHLGMTY